MATTQTQSRRPAIDPTPLFAVVGVTDLAVERVRSAVAGATAAQDRATKAVSEFDAKAAAQEVPTRAVAVALETASKAEARYEDLAKRGKQLVDRVRSQQATQDLLAQAGSTISRTKGAVTTARKAADDTAASVRSTLKVGKREAEAVAQTTASTATKRAESASATAQRSAKTTTTRAKKNASATKSAAKGVKTSATKTASAAGSAAKASAEKVGD